MLLCQTGRTINVPWPIFTILHFLDYNRLLIYFLQKSIPNVLIYLVFSLRQCLPATEENRKIYKHSCSHQWVLTASCGKSFLKKKMTDLDEGLVACHLNSPRQTTSTMTLACIFSNPSWNGFTFTYRSTNIRYHRTGFFFYINVILSVCITSSFKCYIRFPHITFSHFI